MPAFPVELSTILSLLRENPRGMSVTDIAQTTGVNRNTIARYLDMLLISGQVEMKTYGKAKVFFLSRRVPLSAMLNLSSDLLVIFDRNLRIVQANDAVCRFINTGHDSLIGHELSCSPLVAFDHPVIRSQIRKGIEGSEYSDELHFRRSDEDLFFRIKIIPSVFNDGSPGVTLLLEDITSQKRSLEALRRSESMYRNLVEEINDIIWNIDETGIFTYVSPRVKEILGYEADALTGTSIFDLISGSDAEKLKLPLFSEDHAPFSFFAYAVSTRDGNEVILESSGRPIVDEIGIFSGYHIVSRDVSVRNTAMKHVHQWKTFLSSILENIPAKVLVKKVADGKYIFFNRSAEVFFNRTRAEMEGKSEFELFPPDFAERMKAGDSQVLSTGDMVEEPEVPVSIAGGGKIRFLHIKKIPILNSKNTVSYVLTIGEEITDRRPNRERSYHGST